jgi:hypothetical protein
VYDRVQAVAPRGSCRRHGVGVQRVPWARAGSGFVYAFEELCASMAVRTLKSAAPNVVLCLDPFHIVQ